MKIGEIIRGWRGFYKYTLEEASGRIGISLPTLARIERGGIPDGATLWKLLCFMMAPKD